MGTMTQHQLRRVASAKLSAKTPTRLGLATATGPPMDEHGPGGSECRTVDVCVSPGSHGKTVSQPPVVPLGRQLYNETLICLDA
jgi:hypothetical protein